MSIVIGLVRFDVGSCCVDSDVLEKTKLELSNIPIEYGDVKKECKEMVIKFVLENRLCMPFFNIS